VISAGLTFLHLWMSWFQKTV